MLTRCKKLNCAKYSSDWWYTQSWDSTTATETRSDWHHDMIECCSGWLGCGRVSALRCHGNVSREFYLHRRRYRWKPVTNCHMSPCDRLSYMITIIAIMRRAQLLCSRAFSPWNARNRWYKRFCIGIASGKNRHIKTFVNRIMISNV